MTPASRSGPQDCHQPRLAIFFQLDPFNPTIGGIQTCIKYIFKYAPESFRLRLIGITQDAAQVGQWQTAQWQGRQFDFLPLLQVADDNVRQVVPTTVKYAWALRRYLKRQAIAADVYQFHRIEPTVFTQSLAGTKLLYIHNDIYQEVKGKSKGGILWKRFPWAYFALERRLVTQFDQILSCNSQSAQLYRQQYPQLADRVSYLPNTFDSEMFYPLSDPMRRSAREQLAARLSLPPETQFILFAGRLHPQKQPDLLVQAMTQVVQMSRQSGSLRRHLLVVGEGELEAEMHRQIEQLGLGEQVTLLGALPQAELADLYRLSDLYVLTSAYEGLARGSLEALACGVPVVTTRAGETPRFLAADSGLVCAENTPEAIACDWLRVLNQPEAFPSAACVRVARPYEARRVVEALYGTLLAQWKSTTQQQRLALDVS